MTYARKFNHEATVRLIQVRYGLIERTELHKPMSVMVAKMCFEDALNLHLPMGVLDAAGRDPDNMIRSPFS